MSRISIQHFRAALAGRSEQSALVRAYRRLARRPELAAGMAYGDWPVWSQQDSPVAA